MALYEYKCDGCGNVFEQRMPMSDVLQSVPCPSCKKMAKKVIGNFALVGRAEPGIEDRPAPWEEGGSDEDHDDEFGDLDDDITHHGHSHGPGGHTH